MKEVLKKSLWSPKRALSDKLWEIPADTDLKIRHFRRAICFIGFLKGWLPANSLWEYCVWGITLFWYFFLKRALWKSFQRFLKRKWKPYLVSKKFQRNHPHSCNLQLELRKSVISGAQSWVRNGGFTLISEEKEKKMKHFQESKMVL